jgi:hypothetical protein
MRNTNKSLLALIKKHDFTSSRVAELVHVELVTVQHWRQAPGGPGFNPMPLGLLELLEFKLNYDFEGED